MTGPKGDPRPPRKLVPFPRAGQLAYRTPAREILDKLIDGPEALTRVQETPAQDLFVLLREVGLAEATEVLPLCSVEQLRNFFDLDAWKKDQQDFDHAGEWLSSLLESCTDEQIYAFLYHLDQELPILWLRHAFTVHALFEEDDPLLDAAAPAVYTPDNRYVLEIHEPDGFGHVMARLLDLLYRVEMTTAQRLIEGARQELPSALEEDAFRFRTGRLEEMGFFPLAESLQALAYLSPDEPLAGGKPKLSVADGAAGFPPALSPVFETDDLLSHCLRQLSGCADFDQLGRELLSVLNRLAAVQGVEPGDQERLTSLMLAARDTLSLGLAYRAGGDPARATQLLLQAPLLLLYRVGRSLALDRRSKLSRLWRAGVLRHPAKGPSLLDAPYDDFVQCLLRSNPALVRIDGAGHGEKERPFKTLDDLAVADRIIEDLITLARHFFAHLHLTRTLLDEGENLSFSAIFNTCLARRLLDLPDPAQPLEPDELEPAIAVLLREEQGRTLPSPAAVKAGLEMFAAPVAAAEPDRAASAAAWVHRLLASAADQLSGLVGQSELDPRHVGGLWLVIRTG